MKRFVNMTCATARLKVTEITVVRTAKARVIQMPLRSLASAVIRGVPATYRKPDLIQ